MKNTLIITAVKPLSAGNQSLIKNLEPILKESFDNTFLSLRYSKENSSVFQSFFKINNHYNILEKDTAENVKVNIIKGKKRESLNYKFSDILTIENDISQWKITLPSLFVFFPIVLYRLICMRLSSQKIDTIVGYEIQGLIFGTLAKMFYPKSKLVGVFQGTVLGSLLKNKKINKLKAFFKYPVDVIAWLCPIDKYLITDDGTAGDVVASNFGVKSTDILFLHNGVQMEYLFSSDVFTPLKDKYLGVCSMRAVDWKRLDRIPFLALALKKHSMVHYKKLKLVVVGGGPTLENVQKLADDLGVNDCMEFTNTIPYLDSLNYIQKCDFLICVSDVSNLSNSIIDGVTLGKPLLSVDSGSLNNFIETYSLESSSLLLNPDSSEQEIGEKITSFLVSLEKYEYKKKKVMTQVERMELIQDWVKNW